MMILKMLFLVGGLYSHSSDTINTNMIKSCEINNEYEFINCNVYQKNSRFIFHDDTVFLQMKEEFSSISNKYYVNSIVEGEVTEKYFCSLSNELFIIFRYKDLPIIKLYKYDCLTNIFILFFYLDSKKHE